MTSLLCYSTTENSGSGWWWWWWGWLARGTKWVTAQSESVRGWREGGPRLNGALWERQWAHWAVTQRTLTHTSCQRVWKHPHWATMANFIASLGPLWIHTHNERARIRCSVIREIQNTKFLQCLCPFDWQQMALPGRLRSAWAHLWGSAGELHHCFRFWDTPRCDVTATRHLLETSTLGWSLVCIFSHLFKVIAVVFTSGKHHGVMWQKYIHLKCF